MLPTPYLRMRDGLSRGQDGDGGGGPGPGGAPAGAPGGSDLKECAAGFLLDM